MAQGDEPAELLMDLEMAMPAAQGRRGKPLDFTVVRSLAPSDIEKISVPIPATQSLTRVTTAHHRLAQLIAQGKDNTEASMLTGYDPAYISRLKGDKTFADLVATYHAERQRVFTDVLERMKVLGLSTLDELQGRLADEPQKWTKRELMDLAELCLSPQGGGKGHGGGGGMGVEINVNFREPGHSGPTLDGRAEVVR